MTTNYFFVVIATVAPIASSPVTADYLNLIQEAERKTGLPAVIIRAVMSSESAGNPRAISSKGAMGLMQIMPQTWNALRRQYKLGNDPFDPHDNILAGAFYLRALYDAYGHDGFLAAYNAGPGRWENHRITGKPLPAETRAYVIAVSQKIGATILISDETQAQRKDPSWMEAALFPTPQTEAEGAGSDFAPTTSPFVDLRGPLPPSQR